MKTRHMQKKVFLSIYIILSASIAVISFHVASFYIDQIKTSTGDNMPSIFLPFFAGLSIFYCVFIFLNGAFHNKYINWVFILLYFAVLTVFLFFKTGSRRSINLNPLVIMYMLKDRARNEIFQNILAFIGTPIIVKRMSDHFYVTLTVMSFIAVEGLQYIFARGSCDIADLFAYLAAYGLGMLMIIVRDKIIFLPKYGQSFDV